MANHTKSLCPLPKPHTHTQTHVYTEDVHAYTASPSIAEVKARYTRGASDVTGRGYPTILRACLYYRTSRATDSPCLQHQ